VADCRANREKSGIIPAWAHVPSGADAGERKTTNRCWPPSEQGFLSYTLVNRYGSLGSLPLAQRTPRQLWANSAIIFASRTKL